MTDVDCSETDFRIVTNKPGSKAASSTFASQQREPGTSLLCDFNTSYQLLSVNNDLPVSSL